MVGIFSETIIFLALCYGPFLPRLFGTAPLEGQDLLFLLIFPPLMLLADEARKA